MSHYGTSTTDVKSTPKEWLLVGSQIGTLVNKWSGRSDLVVYVGEEMSAPAPALFDPRLAEIEVNAKEAFGFADPEIVGDLNDRGMMYEFPKATGAILHEACHARFSLWDLAKASKDLSNQGEVDALFLLEEGRIEGLGVLTYPENREFLRASAMEIVIGDLTEERLATMSGTRAFAQLAGLVGARIDAGVLDYADVEQILELTASSLGEDLYDKLRSLWRKAQNHSAHSDATLLYPLAIEWERLVSEKAKENGEESESGSGGGGGGIPMPSDLAKAIREALTESAEESAFRASTELGEQEQEEKWSEDSKQRASDSKEREKNRKEAEKVFSNGSGVGESTTGSKLIESRSPTAQERVASVRVGQMLEKAKYRERDVAEITSVLPAGKLRTRTMIQGQALKSKGIHTPVEAWRHKVRKHTDEPTLSVGVLVDISGSMSSAMIPMATTAWVLSEAGRRIQAKTAMVYYGSGVFPTLKSGQHLTEVKVYSAPDGTEKFDQAFRALEGHLNLLETRGAKLLVIVSDGYYTGSETASAVRWVKECDKKGVAVLWITFDTHVGNLNQFLSGTSGQGISLAGKSPEESALLIGKAGSNALESIGRRNA